MPFKVSNENFLLEIAEFIADNGYSPTYMELSQLTKLGAPSVWRKISQLEDDGYITRITNKHRSITLTDKAREFFMERYVSIVKVLAT